VIAVGAAVGDGVVGDAGVGAGGGAGRGILVIASLSLLRRP